MANATLAGEWIVGLGLALLLLALCWQRWFPALTDSGPETAGADTGGQGDPVRRAGGAPCDLPG